MKSITGVVILLKSINFIVESSTSSFIKIKSKIKLKSTRTISLKAQRTTHDAASHDKIATSTSFVSHDVKDSEKDINIVSLVSIQNH